MPLDQEAVSVPVDRSATAPGSTAPEAPNRQPGRSPTPTHDLIPPIDIYEGPDGLVLEADLPGVPEQNLTIQLTDNVLNLRGRVVTTTPTGGKAIHEEYRPGDFVRSFILSDEVDRNRVAASLKNGVLRISLPKAERVRTRKIEIKTS